MTDTTPRLALPLLAAAQAQKHVTHNEALIALDGLVHLTAEDRRAAPPASPSDGSRHIVAASPTGAFAGRTGAVATYEGGAWRFETPARGWIAWLAADAAAMVFDGTHWTDLKPRSADRLGVSATADDTNRLSVASPAVLFSHAGGGSQVKINKAASGETASLLFQSNWSGRAEVGLAGDDDLRVKVSADASHWKTALTVDKATGYVGILGSSPFAPLTIDTDASGLVSGQAAIAVRGSAGAERAEFRSLSDGGPNATCQGFGARGSVAAPQPTRDGNRLFAVLAQAMTARPSSSPFPPRSISWPRATGRPRPMAPTSSCAPRPPARPRAPAPNGCASSTTAGCASGADGTARCALDVDGPVRVKSYTLAALPGASASGSGAIVLVSDETGGPVLAFSDGTAWRRVTDRAVVT